ncbi:MAG: restriction endonuclease subunit S [Bacteroidetes bacterium]|nr:restriction endonuclease subunit S [Bacteroidota bacterium]
MSWDYASLEKLPIDIIDGDRGVNYPKSDEFYDNEYCLFLNTGNVTKYGFEFSKNQFITKDKDEILRKGKLTPNDSVLTTRGTLGNVGFYSDKISYENIRINSGMVILRVSDRSKFEPNYVYYTIRDYNFQQQISNSKSGSAQPQIPIGTLKTLKIHSPPLPTQRKIASILSAYDDLIENNLKRIKLLEEAAQNIYKEWFVHFRFPNHENTKFGEDGLPKGWEKVTIEDFCEVSGGGTPSTKEPKYWDDGNIIWFSPTDLSKNISLVLLGSEKKITEDGLNNSSAKLLPPRTILMSSRATIGLFGIISEPCSTNQGFINIIPNKEWQRYYLLFNLMNRKHEIERNATGTTFKEISKKTFKTMEILSPSQTVCEKFNDFTEKLLNQVEVFEFQNRRLKEARDILLPRLMNQTIEV